MTPTTKRKLNPNQHMLQLFDFRPFLFEFNWQIFSQHSNIYLIRIKISI